MSLFTRCLALAAALLPMVIATAPAHADEAAIRKNFPARMPDFPPIDEVRKTSIPGLYEVRIGNDVYYTDEKADHFFEGELTATKTRENLTKARVDQLTRVEFASLPLRDAIVWKQGTGARKLVVFADPNCGYCKQLEGDLNQLKDVTVYTFVYPILGGDSPQKSRNIWCSRDSIGTWRRWMLDGVEPPRAMGACDDRALERTAAFGYKYKITGTPTLLFEDGKRIASAMPRAQIEKQLVASAAARKP